MKRDIKVNYGILSSIVSDLKQYNEAIESIDGLLININKKLENENDGKAIEALRNKYDKLKVQIDSCKEETKDLYNIFNNYINDMTDIIKPIDEQKMMRVSRNDIYFNKVSIGNACDNIGSMMSGILTSLGSAGTLLTSGTKIKNNIVKMYAISSLAKATSQSLQNDMDDINKLYNENVISYENMDDTYKSKASELYDKYSSVWEKFTTTVGGIGKASVDIVKGFFSSLVGLVKGVFDILKAAVVYIGAGFGAISEKITGDAPDCLKSCERKVKEYNKTIVEIVKDPFSLIEGLSQTLNDTYEEKGIAYMGGYVVGEVAQVLLLKKVSGAKSAKGIDGVEDAAKTVKNVDKAGDVTKGVKGVESVEDGSKIAKESSAIKGVGKAVKLNKDISVRLLGDMDEHIIKKVKDIRQMLPSKYKKSGNFAYADVSIKGAKDSYYAHSGIDTLTSNGCLPELVPDITLQPQNPYYKAINAVGKTGDSYPRISCTEYKILNEINDKVSKEAAGKITLFTELEPCDSCKNILNLFSKDHPNIEINIIHNDGNRIIPKNGY